MAARIAKMRALHKAGLKHVAGWLPKDDAAAVEKQIEAAQPLVDGALKDG